MLQSFKLAIKSIWSNKMRSFLTMLGIIIGIASIISIVSTIKGTNEQIKKNLIGSGTNTVQIQLYQGDYPYFAVKNGKYSPLYLIYAVVQYFFIFASASRGAILFGAFGLVASFGLAIYKSEFRGRMIITTGVLMAVTTVVLMAKADVIYDSLFMISGYCSSSFASYVMTKLLSIFWSERVLH